MLANLDPKTLPLKTEDPVRDMFRCGLHLQALIQRTINGDAGVIEERLQRMTPQAQHIGGDDTLGGYTVPDLWSAAIIEIWEEFGVTRRVLRPRMMDSDTLNVPKLVGNTQVQYVSEAAAIPPTEQTWDNVQLIASKRAVLSSISNELQSDSVLLDFTQNVMRDMARVHAIRLDEEFINGDGTPGFGNVTGLVPTIGSAGVVTSASGTWDGITLPEVHDLMGRLASEYMNGASFICSSEFYHTVLLRLLSEAGGNTIVSLEAGGAANAQLFGYPVNFTNAMPRATATSSKALLFGNFDMSCVFGETTPGPSLATSEHYQFANDLITARSTHRYDLKTHEPGDASNVGGYVALETAAS